MRARQGLLPASCDTNVHIYMYRRAPSHPLGTVQSYFAGLIFTVRWSSTKTAKIGPRENFLTYSNLFHTMYIYINLPPEEPIRVGYRILVQCVVNSHNFLRYCIIKCPVQNSMRYLPNQVKVSNMREIRFNSRESYHLACALHHLERYCMNLVHTLNT